MHTYFRHLNFHRVDVISDEDGTDDMFADPPRIRRTALHTFYSPLASPEEALGDGGRRLLGPDPWVRQVVQDSGAPCDEIIVLINSPRRGGATAPTMEIAYASRSSRDFPDIVVHEAGHSIADLMDEYDNVFPDINWPADWVLPVDPPWVNVDTNPRPPKWQAWLTPGVDLPTPFPAPDGTVGAFEGAAYSKSAVYRPTATCFMRDSRPSYPPFCVVCAEAWIASIYRRSRLADRFMPRTLTGNGSLTTRAGRSMTFGAQVVRPDAIETVWFTRLRGQNRWHEAQRTPAYQGLTTTFDAPGRYEVRVVLRDGTDRIRTPEVRALATQEKIWSVTAF